MRNNLVRKGLVFGIIILFVGTNFIPLSGEEIKKQKPDEREFFIISNSHRNIWYVDDIPGEWEGNPPEDYTSIQSAIDNENTLDGDTIYVWDGSYFENLNVSKQLKLDAFLFPNYLTAIVGDGNDNVIDVNANNVNISGFDILNLAGGTQKAGVNITNYNNAIITNCNIYSNLHGIWIFNSSGNRINGCMVHNNSAQGIRMENSDYYEINSDNIFWNARGGILLINCNNIAIKNSGIIYNGFDGIKLMQSCNNNINGNLQIAHNNWTGICIEKSSNENTLSNNYIHDNNLVEHYSYSPFAYFIDAGILINNSRDNKILDGNTIELNRYHGISLINANNTRIEDNEIARNGAPGGQPYCCGILLIKSNFTKMLHNTVNNSRFVGIYITNSSHHNDVSNNDVGNNGDDGINLEDYPPGDKYEDDDPRFPHNNTITNNVFHNNTHEGVHIYSGSNNKIIHNIVRDNQLSGIVMGRHGHDIDVGSGNVIKDNTIFYNGRNPGETNPSRKSGISYAGTRKTQIENNTIFNQSFGILIWAAENGTIIENKIYNHLISLDPAFQASGIYLSPGGYSSPRNNNIKNNIIHHNFYGIFLDESSDNTISGTIYNNTMVGISLLNSPHNIITKCTIYNTTNFDGILLISSQNNNITNCTIYKNNREGAYLITSNGCTIKNCSVYNNKAHGIVLENSNNNIIYNNKFDNTKNAYDNNNNKWNITKTQGKNIIGGSWLGGNFWSDYTGIDNDGDGLGDTNYTIPGGSNKDHHPLVNANKPPNKPAKPSGPAKGKVNIEYTYTSSTTDVNGDQIYYWFNWGDGTNSGWVGPLASGATASAKHKWTVKGSYQIKVKAKDTNGAESAWSDPLPISIPRNILLINSPIFKLLAKLMERFPHAFSIMRHLMGS